MTVKLWDSSAAVRPFFGTVNWFWDSQLVLECNSTPHIPEGAVKPKG